MEPADKPEMTPRDADRMRPRQTTLFEAEPTGPAGDQDSVAQVQTSVSAAVETCMT